MAAFDDDTLEAVGDLLALGEREGFGTTFTPDAEGWSIGYTRGMGGGDLLTGFDLGETARAAVRPLLALSARYAEARQRWVPGSRRTRATMSNGFEDEEHTEYFALEKPGRQPVVVSRAAFTLSTAGLAQSLRDGTPGFVSDEYLSDIAAETTLTAMELVTAGEWERVDGGYRVLDEEVVAWAKTLPTAVDPEFAPEDCPEHQAGPNSRGHCIRCGTILE